MIDIIKRERYNTKKRLKLRKVTLKMPGETPTNTNHEASKPTGWEVLEDYDGNNQDEFAGERNINDATGKPRTFTQFDNYPRQKGETNEEYGERLKRMNELTAEAEDELYRRSDRGQQERAAEEEYDRITAKLEQAVREGRMTEEHAKNLAEKQLEIFDKKTAELRQKFQEDQALQDWVDSSDIRSREEVLAEMAAAEGQEQLAAEAEETAAAAAEEAEKLEAEEKEKLEAEEAEKLEAEENEHNDSEIAETLEDLERQKVEHEEAIKRASELLPSDERQVSVGDIEIEAPEELEDIEREVDQDKLDRIAQLEEQIAALTPELAELYAKNRRLIIGPHNRAKFVQAKSEYTRLLAECNKLKAETTYESGQADIAEALQTRLDILKTEIESGLTEFAGGDLEHSEKSQEEIDAEKQRLVEEAAAQLRAEYAEQSEALEAEVNASALADFLNQQIELEDATIDRLDNGTVFRKAVSKIITNKYLKGALVAAGIVGLAVTGVGLAAGLAAGTMTVGLGGFTAAGVAAGVARGAGAGALMSRQSSETSAVRGFADESDIRSQIESIDAIGEDASDTANVANWLMDQYESAKDSDLSSNRKRTAVAAGIGAALGALMSGVEVKDAIIQDQVQVGTETTPTEYQVTNFGNVNVPEGHGASTVFEQLGGDPANFQQFEEIMHSVDVKYGMVPGSNGVNEGFNGLVGQYAHTYPGTIDTWPDVAQSYITEVANEAARQGIIPSVQTGGVETPVYDTVTRLADNLIPSGFMNILTQAVATVGAGVAGGAIGGMRGNSTPEAEAPAQAPVEAPEPAFQSEESEEPETSIEQPEEAPEEPEEALTPETPTETPEAAPEQPEPTSVATPEAQPEAASEQPTEQPEVTSEAQPETTEPSPEEQQLDGYYREMVRGRLGSIIGDEGVDIVAMEAASVDNPAAQSEAETRISSWWNNLDDTAKNAVLEYEAENNRPSIYGSALRNWLQRQNLLERPNLSATPEAPEAPVA